MHRTTTAPSHAAVAVVALLLTAACHPTPAVDAPVDGPATSELPVCHFMFDAGSSGTRLHVYEAQADGTWLDHAGPQAEALADPVREQRGKTWADADTVASEVAGLLPKLQPSFDWASRCRVGSAAVFATAGMRLAEQSNPDRSGQMYTKVQAQVVAEFERAGVELPVVEARTLTGFEEGLYAWLAIPGASPGALALAEMGGASSQVAFACPGCEDAHPIRIGGETVEFFSYSFLGLGTDEAIKTVVDGIAPHCAYGVAVDNEDWTPASCEATMTIGDAQGIVDPYNYGPSGQGPRVTLPIDQHGGEWRLTGAFDYWTDKDVQTCCEQRGECYQEQTSCFRAVYLPEYLEVVGVPAGAQSSDASWTLGAVICQASDCLAELDEPLPCRWRPDTVCAPRE